MSILVIFVRTMEEVRRRSAGIGALRPDVHPEGNPPIFGRTYFSIIRGPGRISRLMAVSYRGSVISGMPLEEQPVIYVYTGTEEVWG